MWWCGQGWRAPDSVEAESEEGEEGGGRVVVDVHGLTVVEAQAMLSRKLKELRDEYDHAKPSGREGGPAGTPPAEEKGKEEEGQGGQKEEDGLRDLVVITGFRARELGGTRLLPGEAVVKVSE